MNATARNDTARRLRAQKVFSTDPAWLERMACDLEARENDSTCCAEHGQKSQKPMPLHWTINAELGFVSVVARGDVTRAEAEELLAAMAAQEAMAYRKLFDGTEGSTAMAIEDLRALGVRIRAHHVQGPMGPLALVLPPDKADIILPILGMLAAADRPMRIFKGRLKARRWLSSLGKPLPANY